VSPRFLDAEDVAVIHEYQVERFGGLGGVRDQRLLDSAVGTPSATFDGEFLHSDLYAMAAAYLYHLVKNHPFVDGNKRTGVATALVFLQFNGLELEEAPCERLYDATIAVAESRMSKDDLAVLLRTLSWVEAKD